MDFSNIMNSYIYLHKAIRMRDAALTEKLIEMGIDVNETDDQGNQFINNFRFDLLPYSLQCFHEKFF